MTPEDFQRLLSPGGVTIVQFRKRSWRERLFSLPWRPMVATEQATIDNSLGNFSLPPEVAQFFESQIQAPRRTDIHVPECPHCAIRGMVELWAHRHAQDVSPFMRKIVVLNALGKVVEEYSSPAPEPAAGEH